MKSGYFAGELHNALIDHRMTVTSINYLVGGGWRIRVSNKGVIGKSVVITFNPGNDQIQITIDYLLVKKKVKTYIFSKYEANSLIQLICEQVFVATKKAADE